MSARGPATRERRDPSRLELLLPLACVAGAAVLFASEFMTFFEFTPEGVDPQAVQSASDRHAYAPAILAAFALIALVVAVGGGSKPAALAVAICGGIALLIFLTLDLPDANNVGTLQERGQFLASATAVPQEGFWLLLVGSLSLTLSGIALATLSSDQLALLNPLRRIDERRRRGGRPAGQKASGELARARARRAEQESRAGETRARPRAGDRARDR